MRIGKLDEPEKIKDYHCVKTFDVGNFNEIVYMSRRNITNHIIKISDTEYLNDLKPGEIFEFKEKSKTRDESYESVRTSLSKLSKYIQKNVVDSTKCHWLTLTYSQRENVEIEAIPMRDTKKLYLDFQHFIQALRRFYNYRKIDYIAVAEPQESGSWHLHIILLWDIRAPFLSNSMLRSKFWKNGFIQVQAVGPNCLWLAKYFSSYLTDLELSPNTVVNDGDIIKEVNTPTGAKKYIKGARLRFYPSGLNIYRCSRGIQKVLGEECLYKDALKNEPSATLVSCQSLLLTPEKRDEDIDYDASIIYTKECYCKDKNKAQRIINANRKFKEQQWKK